jgi:hypothetical protein
MSSRLPRIASPRDLLILFIVANVTLGILVNASGTTVTSNGIITTNRTAPYNSQFNKANPNFVLPQVFRQDSPFTKLTNGDILGFVSGLFSINKQSVSPAELLQQQVIDTQRQVAGSPIIVLSGCNVVLPFGTIIPFAGPIGLTFEKDCLVANSNPKWTDPHPNFLLGYPTSDIAGVGNNIALSCYATSIAPNPVDCTNMILLQISNGLAVISGQTGHKLTFECAANLNVGNPKGLRDATTIACILTSVQPVSFVDFLASGIFSGIIFLFGIILLLLSFGLSLSAGGGALTVQGQGGVGVNPQGTKLAQIFGIGLVVYGFIFSEFMVNWLIFPFGVGPTIQFILSFFYFYALWELTTGSVVV